MKTKFSVKNSGFFGVICLLLSSLLLSNCATENRCAKKFPQVAGYDSVYVEKIKEVPIYVPGDTINIEIPAECDDQELFVMENEQLRYELSIEKGKIKTKYIIKPDTIKILVPEIHEKIVIEKKPVEIKYVPKFTSLMSKLGIILALGLVLLFGLKIAKFLK
ncbi:MAG: hypothetical protein PHC64_10775 [Candidatus Gastranaerophilales bacterium]|nr:hypothetical protein [Candidatus Gastranaerophilales bacterium]